MKKDRSDYLLLIPKIVVILMVYAGHKGFPEGSDSKLNHPIMRNASFSINQCSQISILLVSLVFCSCSCKPVINSFKVTLNDTTEVRRMTAEDTLRVNWSVKGTPTLLIHETELPDSGGKVLQLKLVVEKAGKEANRTVQVEMLPKVSSTTITFDTRVNATGDTLIAEGVKNPGVWGDRFEISAVSNTSNRELVVWHANRTALLNKNGTPSVALAGTPVEGRWIFKSLLSAGEKTDHTTLPERLEINTTINYKRR